MGCRRLETHADRSSEDTPRWWAKTVKSEPDPRIPTDLWVQRVRQRTKARESAAETQHSQL